MHIERFDVIDELSVERFTPSGLLWNPSKNFSGSVSLNKGLVIEEN